jgi:hypothetical protein
MSLKQEQEIEHRELIKYLYSLCLTEDEMANIIQIIEENYI